MGSTQGLGAVKFLSGEVHIRDVCSPLLLARTRTRQSLGSNVATGGLGPMKHTPNTIGFPSCRGLLAPTEILPPVCSRQAGVPTRVRLVLQAAAGCIAQTEIMSPV